MEDKSTKILSYTFIISLILLFVLNSQDTTQQWAVIVKNVSLIVALITGFIYLLILLYCLFDNKKIDSLLNVDDYEGLIKYCDKKSKKKLLFIPNRVNYYKYLILLSHLGLDNKEKIDEYFELLKGQEFSFPMIAYWRSCYNFSNGNYETIKEDIVLFTNSNDVRKKPRKYKDLISVLSVLNLYVDGKVKESQDTLATIDTSTIVMPATKRCIEIINNTPVNAIGIEEASDLDNE